MAVVVVIVRGAEVLALRRAAHRDAGAGLWEAVSGRVEPGEEPRAAAAREAREETGLDVRLVERPVDVYAMERARRPMVVVVFRADYISGEVRRSEEHDAHRWVAPEALATLGMPPRLIEAVHRALAARP